MFSNRFLKEIDDFGTSLSVCQLMARLPSMDGDSWMVRLILKRGCGHSYEVRCIVAHCIRKLEYENRVFVPELDMLLCHFVFRIFHSELVTLFGLEYLMYPHQRLFKVPTNRRERLHSRTYGRVHRMRGLNSLARKICGNSRSRGNENSSRKRIAPLTITT